jgi:hypothetical protein
LFFITSRNDYVEPAFSSCSLNLIWNGYYCNGNNEIGVVLFESLDSDAMTRTFSPIKVSIGNPPPLNISPLYYNNLNSFSDKAYTLYGGQ